MHQLIVPASGSGGRLTPQSQEGCVRAAGPQAGRFQFQLFSFNFFGKKCTKILQNILLERHGFHQLIQSDCFSVVVHHTRLMSGEEFGVWRVFSVELFRPQAENGDEVALKRPMPNWHHQLFFLCVSSKVSNIKKPLSDGWWAARLLMEEKQLAGGWC